MQAEISEVPGIAAPTGVPPALISCILDELTFLLSAPLTATSISFPGGTSMCASTVLPVLDGVDTPIVLTSPPPSLPMISLVIANLNPRDLMQLARVGIEVVVPRDCVRNIRRCAYA